MKKILAVAVVVLMTAVLCISASALHHTSADQVMAESDGHDLASVGNNDKENTNLGAITEENIIVWGWHSTEVEGGIDCFGYRYGDVVITDSEKYVGGDADVIASQCGGVEQQVVAVVKLADGTVEDMWTINYTAENGKSIDDIAPKADDPTPTDPGTPDTPSNPDTADASVIAIAAVACIALAGVVVAKKVK